MKARECAIKVLDFPALELPSEFRMNQEGVYRVVENKNYKLLSILRFQEKIKSHSRQARSEMSHYRPSIIRGNLGFKYVRDETRG